MAVFKNYTASGVTTAAVILTGAVGVETTIIGMTVANIGASEASVAIKVGPTHIVKGAPVYVGGAMTPIGGEQKVVLTEGDTLSVSSNVVVDVIVSVLEKQSVVGTIPEPNPAVVLEK